MEAKVKFFQKHPLLQDVLSLVLFVVCVVVGTLALNALVFRSYNVVGGSMENTMHDGDRIIVNRMAVSAAHFMGQEYVPERGQVIVFVNGPADGPLTCSVQSGVSDQYIIKRVIAFPGERVTVKNGEVRVYNDEHPDGFDPDEATRKSGTDGPKTGTTGEVDMTVAEGELFVMGDNRTNSDNGNPHSFDSRYGLGTVPYCRVIGPVAFRLFPFNTIRLF
ncbi:MAG: signal peptidase I [Candidatus Saccharibacteria bacterium]|nr:signal peptidase I [Candidatus Saccharibacteria bacterium]